MPYAVTARILPHLKRKGTVSTIQTIATFLERYGIEVLLIGILVFIITFFLKKIIPESLKNFVGLIPFILGVILYALYSLIFLHEFVFYLILNKGIQSGAIATIIHAFSKQVVTSNGNLKKSVSELLSGILSSKSITEILNAINKQTQSTLTEEEKTKEIEKIILQNTEVPDDVKEVLVKLTMQTLSQEKK